MKDDVWATHVEIGEIEQDATDFLLVAREFLTSTRPDAAMLYCRKALECIVHHLYFLEKGEYPKEKPDGSRPGVVTLLKILKNSMGRQTNTVLFSINAQTRGSMHWDEESRGEVAKNHHVGDVIRQIRSVFFDLFEIELTLDGIEIDDVRLEKALKKNIAIDISNFTNEAQSENDYSEEELEDMDAILDVAEFATGKNIDFDPFNLLELANIAQLRGKIPEAERHFSKALEGITENMVKPFFRAISGLAECALDRGSPEEARNYWNRCRQHAQNHSDQHLESQAIGNLGLAYMREGNLEFAKNLYIESMELQKSEGDQKGVATNLFNITNIEIQMHNVGAAFVSSLEAYQIYTVLNDPDGLANCSDQMGCIQSLLGNFEKALELHNAALELFLSFDEPDVDSVIMCKGNMANCLFQLKRFEDSKAEYDSVVELCEISSYAYGLATSLIGLGSAEFELGNLDSAEKLFSRGELVASESNDMQNMIAALNQLALIASRKKNYDDAIELLKKNMALSEQHGYHRFLETARKNLEAIRDKRESNED